MNNKETEITLIKLSQQGDITSFEKLISLYQQQIFNIAYYKTDDRHLAEDVSQEVIIRIFKKIKTFKFKCSFSSWVYRVTCNIINDIIKKLKPSFEISVEDIEDTKEDEYSETQKVVEEIDRDIKIQKLRKLISKIPHKFQVVLILYEFEGKKYEEIAEILNKNVNTIKTRLYRARQILKNLILNEGRDILE